MFKNRFPIPNGVRHLQCLIAHQFVPAALHQPLPISLRALAQGGPLVHGQIEQIVTLGQHSLFYHPLAELKQQAVEYVIKCFPATFGKRLRAAADTWLSLS